MTSCDRTPLRCLFAVTVYILSTKSTWQCCQYCLQCLFQVAAWNLVERAADQDTDANFTVCLQVVRLGAAMGTASQQPSNTPPQPSTSGRIDGGDSAVVPASPGSTAAPGPAGPAMADKQDRQVAYHNMSMYVQSNVHYILFKSRWTLQLSLCLFVLARCLSGECLSCCNLFAVLTLTMAASLYVHVAVCHVIEAAFAHCSMLHAQHMTVSPLLKCCTHLCHPHYCSAALRELQIPGFE